MIFCARATRGLRRMKRAAWSPSCSRNAHDKKDWSDTCAGQVGDRASEKDFVRCAQLRSSQPLHSLSLARMIEGLDHVQKPLSPCFGNLGELDSHPGKEHITLLLRPDPGHFALCIDGCGWIVRQDEFQRKGSSSSRREQGLDED